MGGEISYIFFYFLYINSQFHYKYAGLFFVQTDHHKYKSIKKKLRMIIQHRAYLLTKESTWKLRTMLEY